VAKTEEKPKKKKPARPKKGLHGWKAALAVFGCGTLAAFGIFGLVVSLLGSLLSTFSDGVEVDDSEVNVAHTVKPREDFQEEVFDFCDIILTISSVEVSLTSEVGRIEDSSIDGGEPTDDDLVRSDQCSGILRPSGSPQGAAPWDFQFSYRAIIYSPEDNREEISQEDFQDWVSDAEEGGVELESSGASNMVDESHYIYGTPGSGSGSEYSVIGRKRSAVFRITMSSADDISLDSFMGEARKFDQRLDNDFGQFIPS